MPITHGSGLNSDCSWPYASIEDLEKLWRPLKQSEEPRVVALLDAAAAVITNEATKAGKNIRTMCNADPTYPLVLKSVVCDIVARALMTSTDQEPMTQMSESAGGYTTSGTFLVPGGGLFIKKSELARLGIRRQKVGVIDIYD